ncbi:hypothetical protein C8Q80DRAFT_604630 [Daedaleopsis nitida]|nr:hypothetical protein C8Q80DRAFT_604630 [Daedaleopsis nitida]
MTLPTLDFDVLLMIQAVADQASISRMMQTCHWLHESGEKVILQNVSMSSGEQFESFGRFLTTGSIYRISLLHSLTLEMRNASTSGGKALKRLFLQLFPHPNLVRLSLRSPERLLSSVNGLSTAIAALTSIKYLAVSCTGPHTISMLRAMRSHLLVVEVTTLDVMQGPFRNGIRCDITSLFHNSQPSLQELRASWPDWTPLDPHAHQDANTALDNAPRFLRVRNLVLDNPYMLAITDYIRTYPNLRALTIHDASDNLFREGDADYRERRDMNIFHQNFYGTWTTLRRFHGSILVLYVLGLTCHVPWVSVDNFDHDSNGSLLHAILLDTRPVHLELRLLGIGSFRKIYAPVLQTAPVSGSLQSLALTVKLSCQDIEMDIGSFLLSDA